MFNAVDSPEHVVIQQSNNPKNKELIQAIWIISGANILQWQFHLLHNTRFQGNIPVIYSFIASETIDSIPGATQCWVCEYHHLSFQQCFSSIADKRSILYRIRTEAFNS